MNGDTPITLTIFLYCFSSAAGAFGVWFFIDARIQKVNARCDALSIELANLKLHIAESYVSKQGLREFRDEVMLSFRDIKEGINHLNDRIDGVVTATPPVRSRTTPRGQS